ncbi:MAG: adenylate/guanylate cyclase domain-containing protein [Burkholderiales bacterium]
MPQFSINDWLDGLGFLQYGPLFEKNAITPELLQDLTDQDLREIGVTMLGHRKRLMAAITSLAQQNVVMADANDSAGQNLPIKAERRQITVLFCDLVGSTQLTSTLDPEDVRQVIGAYHAACRSVIESYQGNVAQFLGDGVMAYFGWPKAHENDAEGAQLCAMELVKKISGLQFKDFTLQARIGLASGTVVVGNSHAAGDNSMLAIGESPNLAARLQHLAEAGEIVLAHSTRKLTKNLFQYADMGMHPIKGIETPVQVWRLNGKDATSSRFESQVSYNNVYVGREDEALRIKHLWQRTKGGEGQAVILQGEPGIGKSRTAKLLETHISGEPHICLHMHASPFHINSAFYPIIAHLLQVAEIAANDSGAEKFSKVKMMMHEHAEYSARAISLIADLLGVRLPGTDPGLGMTSAMKKEITIKYLCAMIGSLSERRPLLLVIEDLHWLDASSLEVIEELLRIAREKRIMIIATSRTESQPKWAERSNVRVFHLGKLNELQSRQLIDVTLRGGELPEELKKCIVEMTDGVPLFIEEMTKSLREGQVNTQGGEPKNFSVTKPMLAVPLTLRDSLMSRLDRLASGRDVAQIASCIGREFDYNLLLKISPFNGESLDKALGTLQAAGLVARKEVAYKDIYVFKHRMVQEVAYDSLLKSLRLQLHGQIATVMEEHFPEYVATQPEMLAHHFAVANMPQKAIVYWQIAGALAKQRMAVLEAVSHFDSALLQLEHLPESLQRDTAELDIRTSLGTAWMALRGWATPLIAEHLGRAWQLAKALRVDDHSLSIIWGLWVQLQCTGRIRESKRWAELLLAEAKRTGDRDMGTAGRMAACVTHYYLGEYRASLRYADSLIDSYDGTADERLADLLNHDPKTIGGVQKAFCLWMLGKPESAVLMMNSTLAHAESRGHAFDICYAVHCAGALAGQICDPSTYLARVEDLVRIGNEKRLPFFEKIMAAISHASWLLISNRPGEAAAEFERIMPQYMATGMGIALTRYMALSAQSHGEAGEIKTALKELEQVFLQVERSGWEEQYYYPEALRIKGEIYRMSENLTEAENNFVAAVELARKQEANSWELRAATSLANLLSKQGRVNEACEWLAPSLRKFDEGFELPDLKQASALLTSLKQSRVIQLTPRQISL